MRNKGTPVARRVNAKPRASIGIEVAGLRKAD